jgi:hypothetical protein
LQHELVPGLSVNVAYFWRSFGNHYVIKNLDTSPSDYSPYCIAAPIDPRLGSVSGQQICGLYDVNPSKFGQVNNLVEPASKYGRDPTETFKGFDINVNSRLRDGLVLSGGTSTGKSLFDNCDVVGIVNNPGGTASFTGAIGGGIGSLAPVSPSTRFCHQESPWLTQVKLVAVYPLPWWSIQASLTFESTAPLELAANYTATSAQILPSLGRSLSSGANGTVTIPLYAPGTVYGDRKNQANIRVTRTFRFGPGRTIQGMLDVYNLFNAHTVYAVGTGYTAPGAVVLGTAWLQPAQILDGRLLKLGVQMEF